jgi:hypothetical protein
MAVALRTLDAHRGGRLVVSGHRGEAERLAALAPADTCVEVESTARSTLENVERSIPFLLGAEVLALASGRFNRRRALAYMRTVRPELAERVVEPVSSWRDGWWMDAAGAAYELSLRLRRVVARGARSQDLGLTSRLSRSNRRGR